MVEGPPTWSREDPWLADVESGEHLAAFRGWHPAVTEMVDSVTHTVTWGIFAARPLTRWFRGRVVLLGDAAHAMLPHHGQGANVTVEDAVALAHFLAGAKPDDLEPALWQYQGLRRARTRTIQRSSWDTNRSLHLPDGRAARLRDDKVARFPEDFGWIHAYDVRSALAGASTGLSAELAGIVAEVAGPGPVRSRAAPDSRRGPRSGLDPDDRDRRRRRRPLRGAHSR